MSPNPKKNVTRIGITLPPPSAGSVTQALYSSGLVQNAILLYATLKEIPGVKPFMIGNYGLAKTFGLDHSSKIDSYLHVVVEVCDKFGPAMARRFRTSGGKLVHHVAGNTMMLNMESASGRGHPSDMPDSDYDAVWILPHQFDSNFGYYSAVYRCSVQRVPMVWDARFLPEDFGWTPQEHKVVACFEPGVSIVKTPHLSILAMEECDRVDPSLVSSFRVLTPARGVPNSFASFIGALNIGRCNDNQLPKLEFAPRIPTPKAFKGLTAVVSHQWLNEFNYVMFEALWGGYPLVHNSQSIKAGYVYPMFAPRQAGSLLAAVIRGHEADLQVYKQVAHNWLHQFRPEVVALPYAELIKQLGVQT